MFKKLIIELSNETKISPEGIIYLFEGFGHLIITLFVIFILTYLLGISKWCLIIVPTIMIFRGISGGCHTSKKICTFISIIIPLIFGLLIENKMKFIPEQISLINFIIVFVIGIIIVYKYVPADTQQKPIISLNFKRKLKYKSFIFLIIILITELVLYFLNFKYFSAITFSFVLSLIWQLFTITPQGYYIVAKLNNGGK